MLVLTRKATEQIQIGENVVITILRVKGQSVRIGIEAPRDVRVMRAELPKTSAITEETLESGITEEPAKDHSASHSHSAGDLQTAGRASARVIHGAELIGSAQRSPLAHMIARRAPSGDRESACRSNPNFRTGRFSRSPSRTMAS